MRQLIVGNWKMHGLTGSATALADALRQDALRQDAGGLGCDLVVCPPATLLAAVSGMLAGTPVAVGGQDCHADAEGAHTGDISAPMLRDAGASYVIVGHSERRAGHAETDEAVRAKAEAAAASGLTAIVCVGETDAQRADGRDTEIVGWQLLGSLPKDFAGPEGRNGVVAYEPIWAIGTGRTPTLAEVAAMHGFIRAELVRQFGPAGAAIRILYGGSVKPANAAGLLAVAEVGGALVGGASLVAADFLDIARAAKRV